MTEPENIDCSAQKTWQGLDLYIIQSFLSWEIYLMCKNLQLIHTRACFHFRLGQWLVTHNATQGRKKQERVFTSTYPLTPNRRWLWRKASHFDTKHKLLQSQVLCYVVWSNLPLKYASLCRPIVPFGVSVCVCVCVCVCVFAELVIYSDLWCS